MRGQLSLCACVVLMAVCLAAPCAYAAAPIAGRPVIEVLQESSASGLKIVYSEALVTPNLRVLEEPAAREPVARLREILAPHGLALEPLEGGTFVVIRAREARSASDEASAPLEEVRVLSSRYTLEGASSGQPLTLDAIELESQPALLDDAARGIRRFPGTAGNSFSSRVFVRGGLSDENLILLDGVPLQEPFHLPGLPADLSLLDPVTLQKIDFYSGVLPLEYGGRMSSIIDMRTRSGAKTFGGRASLGTMNASTLLEGALPGERGNWLAFGRRSLLDQVARLADAELGRPRMSDAFGRVRLRFGESSVLMFGGLVADDDITLSLRDGIEASRGESDRTYFWSALDTRWGSADVRTLLTHASSNVERAGELQDPAGSTGAVIDRRGIETTLLRQDSRRPFGKDGVLRWGASARRDRTNYDYARAVDYPPEVAALYGQDASATLVFTGPVRLTEYEGYLGASQTLGSRWSLEGGVHVTDTDYSTGQAHTRWDPRAALLYHFSPTSRVRMAWGRMRQTWASSELPLETDGRVFEDDSVGITRVLGWEHELARDLEMRIELYDKKVHGPRARRENLLDPITLIPDLRPDATVIRPDLARVAGVDVHLTGSLSSALEVWASYSWSHARDVIDGREVPRSWDQRHSLVAGLSYERSRWLLSGAVTARSDWPVTPIVPASGALGIALGERNSTREGLFFTLDLRAERRFQLSRGELRAAVELQNATDRANPCCTEIRFERDANGTLFPRTIERNWAPFVPQLNVAWEF